MVRDQGAEQRSDLSESTSRDPGGLGELFLGQVPLPAQLPQAPAELVV